MNPPLRDKSHYDRLWYGVRNNFNDTIGSDHAPHLKVNKEKEYPNSPSGMPGVQTLMPVMLNHVNDGKLSLNQLINLVCENPVKIFGIKNKGFIKEGYDADFTIVDMKKTIEIKNVNIELGNSIDFKLYNLKEDPSQKSDLSKKEPEKLKEMIASFVKIRGRDFSNIENLVLE